MTQKHSVKNELLLPGIALKSPTRWDKMVCGVEKNGSGGDRASDERWVLKTE